MSWMSYVVSRLTPNYNICFSNLRSALFPVVANSIHICDLAPFALLLHWNAGIPLRPGTNTRLSSANGVVCRSECTSCDYLDCATQLASFSEQGGSRKGDKRTDMAIESSQETSYSLKLLYEITSPKSRGTRSVACHARHACKQVMHIWTVYTVSKCLRSCHRFFVGITKRAERIRAAIHEVSFPFTSPVQLPFHRFPISDPITDPRNAGRQGRPSSDLPFSAFSTS